MVQLTMNITASLDRAHQLVDVLQRLMRRALQTKGCARARIAADLNQADSFWYCEDWEDEAAFEARVRSDQFSQVLAVMETSSRPPVLEFRTIGESRGLEYVAAVRAADSRNGSLPPDILRTS